MLMNTVILFDDYVPDDHSAWTCSLSQDKVSMMLLMISDHANDCYYVNDDYRALK